MLRTSCQTNCAHVLVDIQYQRNLASSHSQIPSENPSQIPSQILRKVLRKVLLDHLSHLLKLRALIMQFRESTKLEEELFLS